MVLPIDNKAIRLPEEIKVEIFCLIRNLLQQIIPSTSVGSWAKDYIQQWFLSDPTYPELGAIPYWSFINAGGNSQKIIPALAAWQLIRLSAKLFDDIEDGIFREKIHDEVNKATVILFAAQLALGESVKWNCTNWEYFAITQKLNQACLLACEGQQQDFHTSVFKGVLIDPDGWKVIAQNKSGELFAWACWVGAFLAGAETEILAFYTEIGMNIGILLQVVDDYWDIWNPNGSSDLSSGRVTLPISYALHNAKTEEQVLLKELIGAVMNKKKGAEKLVIQFLSEKGTEKFIFSSAYYYYCTIDEILKKIDAIESDKLLLLLKKYIPVFS